MNRQTADIASPLSRLGAAVRACTTAALVGAAGTSGAQLNLPEIGDPTGGSVSAADERRIGEAFMREVRGALEIVDDPEVESYIQRMGYRLSSAAGAEGGGFYFFVVRDPAINAFAAPGGFIGVNTGLILASESEGELASVMAHEVAHVTQRHIARRLDMAGRSNVYMIAGMLAAIAAGMANAQAGQAAAAAVMGAQYQSAIDFTRANEKEADRVGMQYLAGASYDPRAMPAFFERLQQASRYYRRPPEFLSTHPVTTNRIADTRGRAEQYPYKQYADSLAYHLVRAKLQAFEPEDPQDAVLLFEDRLANRKYTNVHAAAYGWGIALMRSGRYEQAREVLTELVETNPNVVAFRVTQARNELAANNLEEALKLYRLGYDLFPDNKGMVRGYVSALVQARRGAEALRVIDGYTRLHGADAALSRVQAEAFQQAGQPVQSQLALAEHYYAYGQLEQAIQQLRLAAASPQTDYYLGSRVEARLNELEQERAQRQQRR